LCLEITNDAFLIAIELSMTIITVNSKAVDPVPITKQYASTAVLDEYRKIRVFLAHGYLQQRKTRAQKPQVPISVQDIVWAKKVLFDKTSDLIQLSFMVASQL
jgi:hypothetical protein